MVIKRPMMGVLAMLILGELLCAWAGLPVFVIVFILCAVVLVVLIRQKIVWSGYFFLVFFMVLGYFRMQEIQKASQIQTDDIYQVAGKIDKIVEKDGYSQFYLYNAAGLTKDGQKSVPGVILNVSEKNQDFLDVVLAGDEILAQVSLKRYEPARNPGNFDAESYYETMNIVCYGWCDSVTVVSRSQNPVLKGIFQLKDRLKYVYEQVGTDADQGVYRSLVLGDQSSLDTTVKELYRVNGIAHILAISGVKTLNLALPREAKKPENSAFLRVHRGKIYIKKWQF